MYVQSINLSGGTGCTSSQSTLQLAQAVRLVNQPFNWPKYTASQPTLQLPQSTLQLAQTVRPANQPFQSINPSTGTSYTSSQSTFQLAQAVRPVDQPFNWHEQPFNWHNQPFNWHKLYVQSINLSSSTSGTSSQPTLQLAQAVRRVNQPFNVHKLYVESIKPSTGTSYTSSRSTIQLARSTLQLAQSTLQLAQAVRPVNQPLNWHNRPFNWHKLHVESINHSAPEGQNTTTAGPTAKDRRTCVASPQPY